MAGKKQDRRVPDVAALARRNEYATKFFPFVEKVARRLARRLPGYIEVDDLISAGVIGLMDAAERYDPAIAERFEMFAEFRIRGAMLDELRSRDTLSRDMRLLSNELRDAARHLEMLLGRTPDHEEIAKYLGVGIEELYARQQKLSGSSVVGIDDAGPDLLERTADTSADDSLESAFWAQARARLVAGLCLLPDRKADVVDRVYFKGQTLKEVARALGVTESRVCQIAAEACRALRDLVEDPR